MILVCDEKPATGLSRPVLWHHDDDEEEEEKDFYCCTMHFDITMYFYWSIPQYFSFNKAQHTLPEDGPIGPKRSSKQRDVEYFLLGNQKTERDFNILFV
jgi:hypothetical protein